MRISRLAVLLSCLGVFAPMLSEAQIGSTRLWNLGLSFQETFDDNTGIPSQSLQQSDFISRVGLNVGFSQSTERLSLDFGASTGALIFTNVAENNNLTVNGSLSAGYQWTERTQLSFSQSLSQDFSYASSFLADRAIVLPVVLARSVSSGLALSHSLSEKTSLTMNGSFDRILFDDPLLVGGSTLGGGVSIGRALNERNSLNLSYRAQTSAGQGSFGAFTSHGVSGGWTRTVSARTSFGMSAGVDASRPQQSPGTFYSLNGNAFVSSLVGRGALSLSYGRSVSQAFGFGFAQLSDSASLSFSHPLNVRTAFNTSASYAISHDLSDELPPLQFSSASVGLSFRVTESLNVGANYSFRYSITPLFDDDELSSNSGSVSVSYGWSWQ